MTFDLYAHSVLRFIRACAKFPRRRAAWGDTTGDKMLWFAAGSCIQTPSNGHLQVAVGTCQTPVGFESSFVIGFEVVWKLRVRLQFRLLFPDLAFPETEMADIWKALVFLSMSSNHWL